MILFIVCWCYYCTFVSRTLRLGYIHMFTQTNQWCQQLVSNSQGRHRQAAKPAVTSSLCLWDLFHFSFFFLRLKHPKDKTTTVFCLEPVVGHVSIKDTLGAAHQQLRVCSFITEFVQVCNKDNNGDQYFSDLTAWILKLPGKAAF